MNSKTGSLNNEDLSVALLSTGNGVVGTIHFNGGEPILLEPNTVGIPVEPPVLIPNLGEGDLPLVVTSADGGSGWERYLFYQLVDGERQYFESSSPFGTNPTRITTEAVGNEYLVLNLKAVAGPTIVIGTVIIDVEQD